MSELREEVTRARAAAVMAEARIAWVEKMAQERAILLAAQRVSILEGELMTARQAWDTAIEKLPSLAAKVTTADQR
jgi:hypothetical protein